MRKQLITLIAVLFMVMLCQTVAAADNSTEGNTTTVLVIGSSTATKSYNEVAYSVMNLTNRDSKKVKFQIRSTSQIGNMTGDEIASLINASHVILAEWGTALAGNGSLEAVIRANPSLIENKVFLVFESGPTIVKLSRINNTNVFSGVNDSDIGTYDKPGSLIGACHDGDLTSLISYKQKYPGNTALHQWIDCAIYYAASGKKNLGNQFKLALKMYFNMRGLQWNSTWDPEPVEPASQLSQEFLYRDGQRFTLADYFSRYPLDQTKPTLAVLSYISSAGEVQYADSMQQIIDEIVSRGMNVIPLVGTWSSYIILNQSAMENIIQTLCLANQTYNITAIRGIGNYSDTKSILGVTGVLTAKVYEVQILENGNVIRNLKISTAQPVNVYSALVKFLTDASNVVQYEANPEKYPVKVNAIIDMLTFITGSTTSGNQVNRFFENSNVPVLRALITSSKYRTMGQWIVSEEGFSWMSVYWQCAQPEMQGQIEPLAIGVGEIGSDPETGAEWDITVTIPERIEKLVSRAFNWIRLQTMANSDKRIAIVYYNYPPGKQNIGASYLNVPESIIEILKRMKAEGYNVGEILEDADALVEMMIRNGINVANWAPGELEKLASSPNAILWPYEDYLAWFNTLDPVARKEMVEGPVGYIEELTKLAVQYISGGDSHVTDEMLKTLNRWTQEMISNANTHPEIAGTAIDLINKMSAALAAAIQNTSNTTAWDLFYIYKNQFMALNVSGMTGWGEPPGNVMVVTRNGRKYIVIPGLMFGNVFIGPEPQRGWEADVANLYHSTIVPPPHCYLAWYAWVNTVFGANAQIHVGRHATYEWTPRKQYALAAFDYPDICIGNTPSLYIYIMDGVGEGMQAKRRGLAVIIDHLTPPLTRTKLYGDLQELAGLLSNYEMTPDGNPMKEEYANRIRETVIKLNLERDLGINATNITDEDIDRVHDYILSITSTLIPYGLDTFGLNWTDSEVALMVSGMLSADSDVDPSLPRLISLMRGWNFNNLTFEQAESVNNATVEMILELLRGKPIDTLLSNVTDPSVKTALQSKLEMALQYISLLKNSPSSEMDALMEGLSGHYITPAKGGDPVKAPYALPTGRNFYAQDDNTLPTKVAWDLGKRLADMALAQLDTIPEKMAAVVWCVETARDDGTMVSFVLRMLGVQPKMDDRTWLGGGKLSYIVPTNLTELLSDLNRVRNSMGLLNLTSRPRIDVIVTTSGLFRDLYPNLLAKMDVAYRVALGASYSRILAAHPELKEQLDLALNPLITGQFNQAKTMADLLKTIDKNDSIESNYIAKHWIELVLAGYDGDAAITRIFAPPVGDYGAGVNHGVEEAWTWNDRSELADVYLRRMSHAYSNTLWGASRENLFEDLLKGVKVAYHSRSTNLYGVIDNDDYYDYYGGLSMAIEKVNGGVAPSLNVLYYANPSRPEVVSLQEFMRREMRTRYYNPEWIKSMMNEGYSGARTISNKFVAYLWGWQVTTPELVDDYDWNEITDVYIRDRYNLGVTEWLSTGNRAYAMISITGTLLTAAHKGFWKADEATLRLVANKWASTIAEYGVACCDCSCGNIAMMQWVMQYVNPDLLSRVKEKLYAATKSAAFAPAENPNQGGESGSTPGSAPGSQPQGGSTGSEVSGRSGGSSGASTAGPGTHGSSQNTPAESAASSQGAGKSYEVTKAGSSGASSTGMPVYAIIGVIALVALVGVGYFLGPGRR
ncbi:cobaltochelatase subunit CobN [Methanothermobacter sp.]|uniref:cobaltochelatase subunit CobN n=1 Tax=Methanothermobacter sp. TaxID=1884223 RepID=UPI003C714CEF